MKNLDLVITADTALGHLAGALGVPAWIAVPLSPDWRWLLDREDSPWYPTVRLFRQTKPAQWTDVFERIAQELQVRAESNAHDTITAPISAGELLDKIAILEIKSERISDPQKLANVRNELAVLHRVCEPLMRSSEWPALAPVVAELKAVNEALWEIEDAIRICERQRDFGDHFIELARSVYRRNDHRAALKKQINQRLGSALVEEKSYQEYQ